MSTRSSVGFLQSDGLFLGEVRQPGVQRDGSELRTLRTRLYLAFSYFFPPRSHLRALVSHRLLFTFIAPFLLLLYSHIVLTIHVFYHGE